MENKSSRPGLYLVKNIEEVVTEGPITRMDLWYRFQPVPLGYWLFLAGAKLALIGSVAYYYFGL